MCVFFWLSEANTHIEEIKVWTSVCLSGAQERPEAVTGTFNGDMKTVP